MLHLEAKMPRADINALRESVLSGKLATSLNASVLGLESEAFWQNELVKGCIVGALGFRYDASDFGLEAAGEPNG